MERSGSMQGAYREDAERMRGTWCRAHAGYVQGRFGENLGKIKGSGNIQKILRKH
jgi:hypothetical protein